MSTSIKLPEQIDGEDAYEARIVNEQSFELEEIRDELSDVQRQREVLSRRIEGEVDETERERLLERRAKTEPGSKEYAKLTALVEGEEDLETRKDLRVQRRALTRESAGLVEQMLRIMVVNGEGEQFTAEQFAATPVRVQNALLDALNDPAEEKPDPTDEGPATTA